MGFLDFFKADGQAGEMPWYDGLMSLAQAAPFLQDRLETHSTGQAGLLVRPRSTDLEGDGVAGLKLALNEYRDVSEKRWNIEPDDHGHYWVIARDETLEELVVELCDLGNELVVQGYEDSLIAAVFPLLWKERRLYWIYNWALSRFTPFVPADADELRDYPLEVRMESSLRKYIPTSRDASNWYPLWGLPV